MFFKKSDEIDILCQMSRIYGLPPINGKEPFASIKSNLCSCKGYKTPVFLFASVNMFNTVTNYGLIIARKIP